MIVPIAFLTGMQLIVILLVAVAFCGRRLVKGIVELRNGMNGPRDDL